MAYNTFYPKNSFAPSTRYSAKKRLTAIALAGMLGIAYTTQQLQSKHYLDYLVAKITEKNKAVAEQHLNRIEVNGLNSYDLKRQLLGYYNKILDKDIVYAGRLLLNKGAELNHSRYCKIISHYNNRKNIFVDNDGKEYRNIAGVNSHQSYHQHQPYDYQRNQNIRIYHNRRC